MQLRDNTTEKLKEASREYNGLTASILDEVSKSIKRIIQRAKAKLAE
ncbi:MAG: hypothetical protein AAGJ18_26420 [Bacteroidota bacterium]